MKIAHVSFSPKERDGTIFYLESNGFIKTTLDGKYKIEFISENQDNPVIIIDDETRIVDFLPFVCSVCGKEIEKKNNRHKMCDECWKKTKNANNKIWMQEHRK